MSTVTVADTSCVCATGLRPQLALEKLLTRLTLDIIGLSAFGYSFNALEDTHSNELCVTGTVCGCMRAPV